MNTSIIEHFSSLQAPRIERKKLHALMDIIVIVICGIISGAEGWEAIEEFGHEKEEWLRKFIPLKNGIPSHDCIAYVISRLSVKGFQECFMSWTQAVMEKVGGQVISVDGKTARGSKDSKNNRSPLHTVSAWASESHLVLGQEATAEKSNEITAIPKLLALLPNIEKWVGLKSIGMVERVCLSGEKETLERRYFINSFAADAKIFAKAVREHWGVENRLHWRLDVVFREDESRIRKANAPAIMTTTRHLCMGLFDADPTPGSLAKKRRKASWSDTYRAKLVFGQKF